MLLFSCKQIILQKNNKVNWGETTQYGNHAFAEDFTKEHTVKLEGLTPGIAYKFEVMSQNRNYVYDSFHEFITKPEQHFMFDIIAACLKLVSVILTE